MLSCMLGCCWVAASVRPGPALRGSAPHALRAGTPCCSEPALPRRVALQLAVAATAAAEAPPRAASARETGRAAPDRAYGPLLQGPFDFPAPGSTRATLRRELVPGRIWSFEQVQGVIFVHVPVRMTVVRLDSGGLFVYAPVAPTTECLRLLAELEAVHGDVKHILLPTLAIEHKAFAGAFAEKRPAATLWVAAGQYSFPLDLPLLLQGFPRGTRTLPPEADAAQVPWAAQLPYKELGPLNEKIGGFAEVVVFDQPTLSLLVTDLVVAISEEPPAIIAENDVRALLYHSRDGPTEQAVDTPAARKQGYQKICLFACYFQSSTLDVPAEPDGTLEGAKAFFRSAFPPEVPAAVRALGWKGFIAWRWQAGWPTTFDALRYGGRPFVPPILQELVLNREPKKVLAFAERVAADFAFTTIIPAHFDAVVPATPEVWLDAFRPFGPTGTKYAGALPTADLAFLRAFEDTLVRAGTIRPRACNIYR